MTLSLFMWAGVRMAKDIQLNHNCIQYIEKAATSNTVEIAKENLSKVITYAEEHNLTEGTVSIFYKQPMNDIGYWYKQITAIYNELDKLSEDSTPLERSNVLMKLNESLTDKEGFAILPDGLSIYPDNVAYFWWAIVSLLNSLFFWIAAYARYTYMYFY